MYWTFYQNKTVRSISVSLSKIEENPNQQLTLFDERNDDGGHLIGSQFRGSEDIDNLVAQNSQINRSGGEWYKMEKVWANALKEVPPKKVSIEIELVYKGDSLRPSSFEIFYKVEGKRAVKKIIKNQPGGW